MIVHKPERVSAPAAALLSVDQVKEYLRIDHDAEDALIAILIDAATESLDGYSGLLGRALVTQEWRQSFGEFPSSRRLSLPLGRVQEVVSVTYVDELDAQGAFTDWHLVEEALGPTIVLADGATWPSTACRPDAVIVTWRAGYGDAPSDVPHVLHVAALQLVAHWYENREPLEVGRAVNEIPWGLRQTILAMRAHGG